MAKSSRRPKIATHGSQKSHGLSVWNRVKLSALKRLFDFLATKATSLQLKAVVRKLILHALVDLLLDELSD